MATHVLKNVHVFADHYDLTCALNELQLQIEAEMLDETTFCQDTRKMKPGLISNVLSYKGFLDFSEINTGDDDSIDELHFSRIALEDTIVTIGPDGSDAGDRAYAGLWNYATYSPGAEVGQLLAFDLSAVGHDKLSRGQFMLDTDTAITESVASSKYQLGAVSAGNQLVAYVHCFAFDGSTLDIAVRSDADSSSGSETTRGSFTQITGVTSERIVIDAPITDEYWDVSLTFDGTSASLAIVLAIEPVV